MARSRVVVLRAREVLSEGGRIDREKVQIMFKKGFERLLDGQGGPGALASIFRPRDRVGIKVNTIGGRAISTRPEVALALADWLGGHGLEARNIVIWDRTNRELREAGYRLSSEGGPRIFGTDTDGLGYGRELVSHLNVGSLFSTIQTDLCTASVSLGILKDHGLAGITGGMKNYFGAIHNPNKYHDTHCDPFVAEVFDAPPVKIRHRVSVLDCLLVQYHRGPSFHPQWAERFQGLIFSFDPVAADAVGWGLVERLRAAKGLPSLQEEGRAPGYLATAERMGLGHADPASIETLEETVT